MSILQSSVELNSGVGSSSKEIKIPVHIRFVPRDVWIRMHINTGSTIGAVKDAALERINIPPLDPTIMPDFYELARNVSSKSAQRTHESRTFPKAFLARRPKGSLAEILNCDGALRKESNQSMKAAFISSPSRIRNRRKDMSEVAKQILGSDPGESAMGSLGYVSSQCSNKILQHRSMESLSGDAYRLNDTSRVVSSPSSSSTSSRFINSVKGAKGPKTRASMASLSAAVKAVHRAASSRDLQIDAKDIPERETYSEYLASGLTGNIEAKRREEEAMTTLKKSDYATSPPSSPLSRQYKIPFQDQVQASSSGSRSVASNLDEVQKTIESSIGQTALDSDYSSSSDNESDHSVSNANLLGTTKTLLSSESDLSSSSHLERHASPVSSSSPITAVAGLKSGRERMQSQTMADFAASAVADRPSSGGPTRQKTTSTSLSINANTERGRSGTILASTRDVKRGKLPIDMIRSYSDQSAQSGVYENIKGSVSNTEMNRIVKHRRSQELPRASCDTSLLRSQKLAGIRLDEISSWKEARHAMSQHFMTYSYSNGNMLEDWRTVAAFKVRPFELLEIHYANPYERIFLPREKSRTEELLHRSSSATLLDAQTDGVKADPYIEPRGEAWCYIFKPNSGPGKTHRAGLGVWKLRFIIVKDNRLIICRKKPGKGNNQELQDAEVWPLDMIDCVWTEQAKGGTQPAVTPLQGDCQDLLTITVPANVAPDGSALVSTYADSSSPSLCQFASLSMRFITQSDCHAFFNTFARALKSSTSAQAAGKSAWINEWRKKVVTRSTIAGMGGVVLPSKIGRKGGRNTLARRRLRPPGVNRAFDDADQWSSHSEDEDYDKVKSNGNTFGYADLQSDPQKELSTNPAFEMEPLVKTTSIQSSLAPISPKTTRVNLSTADEMDYRAATNRAAMPTTTSVITTTSVVTATPEKSTPKAERRSRGFSLAKVARRVVTPHIDRNSLRGGTNSAPSFDDGTVRRGGRRSTVTPNDLDQQDVIHHITRSTPGSPNKDSENHHQYHRKQEESIAAPPRTPIRTSSQSYSQLNRSGPITPSSLSSPRKDLASPDSSRGSRHRSHTVVQGSSTAPILPPSPGNSRRSIDLRQTAYTAPSSSSNTNTTSNTSTPTSHHQNVFHWPFRNPSHRASTTARSALHKEVAE